MTRLASKSRWWVVAAMVAVTTMWAAPAQADGAPYDDAAAVGGMALCDRDLQPLTEGSITDRPFVWRAVSDVAAEAPYNDKNRRAVLYAYQPREGVEPALWSGELLTAASTYSDPQAPIAQATPIDVPLEVFIKNFPPQWDGSIQLRMYFTTDLNPQSTDYVAADLRVEGDTWRLVSEPSKAPCDAGKAVSPEVLLPDYKERVAKVRAQEAKQDEAGEGAEGASPEGEEGTAAGSDAGSTDAKQAAAAVDLESGSGAVLWWVLGLAVVVMAAVGGAVTWFNRRA
jgi:hypothetical protein